MIQKSFDAIDKPDIEYLVECKAIETKTLEYKECLPGRSDGETKEFLADVTSFANASGGDILYGIKAAVDENGKKTGAPECIVAMTGSTLDETKLRLENMIRDSIQPRLRVQIKEFTGWGKDEASYVLLLRIPKSFASPHMVTYKGSSRFFSRNSAGKFPLDFHEIRNAFWATESQADRMRRFRLDRLGKIFSDETPVPLTTPHRLVLHLIPVASFLNNEHVLFPAVHELSSVFRTINAMGGDYRYNLDGFVTYCRNYSDDSNGNAISYTQLFHDGTIEAVHNDFLTFNGGPTDNKVRSISSSYESELIRAIESYFEGFKKIGLPAPVVVSLAILGCKGLTMATWPRYCIPRQSGTIDRDVAAIPEMLIDSFDIEISRAMKPLFDGVWNACGYSHSYSYDENGNWSPPR